jgi:chemotaxis protein histidine kinase CheA
MTVKKKHSFQEFVISEFLEHNQKLASASLPPDKQLQNKKLLYRIFHIEDEVFQQVENLAQIPGTTEITIFFSDFLERLDFADPFDIVDTLDDVINDYITLIDLLLDEEEYSQAILTFIKGIDDAKVESAQDKKDKEDIISEIDSAVTEKSAETHTIAAKPIAKETADTIPAETEPVLPDEPIVADNVKSEEFAPEVSEKTKTKAMPLAFDAVAESADPLAFSGFVFSEIKQRLARPNVEDWNKQKYKLSVDYLDSLEQLFNRNPELLNNQPNDSARFIAGRLIYFLNFDASVSSSVLSEIDAFCDLFANYVLENEKDLKKSFSGKSGRKKTNGTKKTIKGRKKSVKNFAEKELERLQGEVADCLNNETYDLFPDVLTKIADFSLVQGFDGLETMAEKLKIFMLSNKEEITNAVFSNRRNELGQQFELLFTGESNKDEDQIESALYALLAIVNEEKTELTREKVYSLDEVKVTLKSIWLNNIHNRQLDGIQNYLEYDRENAHLLNYSTDFIESFDVIISFLDQNNLNPEYWEEYFYLLPEAVQTGDHVELVEVVNKALDLSTGSLFGIDNQERIQTEIFTQLHKRFNNIAAYYQLTDDEQAGFQQQISELSEFIADEAYRSYVTNMIQFLNNYFYDVKSDQLVRKYLKRIAPGNETYVFPVEDIEKIEAGIEEVASATPIEEKTDEMVADEQPVAAELAAEEDPTKTDEATDTEIELDATTEVKVEVDAGSEGWINEIDEAVADDTFDELESIFFAEAQMVMAEIDRHLDEFLGGDRAKSMSIETALHSIVSSSGMAGMANIAGLSEDLEKVFERLANHKTAEIPDTMLRSGIAQLGELISRKEDSDLPMIKTELNDWLEDHPFDDVFSDDGFDDGEVAGVETAIDEDDTEMLEVFRSEVAGNIESIKTAMSALRNLPENNDALGEMNNGIHNIMTAAKMLGFSQAGDLAEHLERRIEQTIQSQQTIQPQNIDALAKALQTIESFMSGDSTENDLKGQTDQFDENWQSGIDSTIDLNGFLAQIDNAYLKLLGQRDSQMQAAYVNALSELTQFVSTNVAGAPVTENTSPAAETSLVSAEQTAPKATGTEPELLPVDFYTSSLIESSNDFIDGHFDIQTQVRHNQTLLNNFSSTKLEMDKLRDKIESLKDDDDADSVAQLSKLNETMSNLISRMSLIAQELNKSNTDIDNKISQIDDKSIRFQRSLMAAQSVNSQRLVEDVQKTSNELTAFTGKDIDVQIAIENLQIDKSVFIILQTALRELLVNSAIHGLEDKKSREKAGKTEQGILRVTLNRYRNLLHLTIMDDGAGLNTALAKDVAQKSSGLFAYDDEAPESIFFNNRFSLATEENDYAGDGTGLYNLQKSLSENNGSVRVITEPGKFTQVEVTLPEPLRIAYGAVVRSAKQYFAIPLMQTDLKESITTSQIIHRDDRYWYKLGDETLPVILFSDLLQQQKSQLRKKKYEAILFHYGDSKAFVVFDSISAVDAIAVKAIKHKPSSIPFVMGLTKYATNRTLMVINIDEILRSQLAVLTETAAEAEPLPIAQGSDSKLLVLSEEKSLHQLIKEFAGQNNFDIDIIQSDKHLKTLDSSVYHTVFVDNTFYQSTKSIFDYSGLDNEQIVILHDGEIRRRPSFSTEKVQKPLTIEQLEKILL